MKKMISGLFSLSMLVMAATANAQDGSFASYQENENTTYNVKADEKTVNSVIVKDFTKNNAGATDVLWSTSNNMTSVSYKKDGISMRSNYDAKGKLEYTMAYMFGENIPRKIVNLVRRDHYKIKITQVIALTRHFNTSYFVKMEDETTYLTLLVQGSEISEYESLRKQK